jgi:serine/threonine-protein kinase
VLVSSRGQAKLVDFGLASADDAVADNFDSDMPSTRTVDYAALERATGVRRDDPRSDVYFAGCIYYHLLTGVAPLEEVKNRVQRLNKTRFSQIVPIHVKIPNLPLYVTSIVNKAMSFDPGRRYQAPGEMRADLETTIKRLEEDPTGEKAAIAMAQMPAAVSVAAASPVEQRSVMIVEPNVKLQDIFRNGLKKAGYRVLLTSDPNRAFERVTRELNVADCIVFNARELGESALDVFNRLTTDEATQALPAILLLEENQRGWKERANTADHRIVLSLPLTLKDLRVALGKLIPSGENAKASA